MTGPRRQRLLDCTLVVSGVGLGCTALLVGIEGAQPLDRLWIPLGLAALGLALRDLVRCLPAVRSGDGDEPLGSGPWRHGRQLIVRRGVPLAGPCVVTGRPTDTGRHAELVESHPLLLLASLCLFSVDLNRRAGRAFGILLPLAEEAEELEAHRRRMGWAWLASGSIALALSLFVNGAGVLDALTLLAAILACIFGVLRIRRPMPLPTATRVTHGFARLSGVHPDALAELPRWPCGPWEPAERRDGLRAEASY